LVGKIAKEGDENGLAKTLVDLAMLSQGMLSGSDLTKFIEKSVENLV
jgi:molecular chaperone HtpG